MTDEMETESPDQEVPNGSGRVDRPERGPVICAFLGRALERLAAAVETYSPRPW